MINLNHQCSVVLSEREKAQWGIREYATLSTLEKRTAKLMIRGLDNDAIAKELKVTKSTIKNIVHTLLWKFKRRSRVQFVTFYLLPLNHPLRKKRSYESITK